MGADTEQGWALAPGGEDFVFAYSQHRYTNRQAVPLLIAATRCPATGSWRTRLPPPPLMRCGR
ncbi:hypothetical protein NZK33_07075 [Cyanobium sp. FGCU-6]|nr:hypothetical protein [Cyanobium sp. FGCU6]